MRLKMEEYTKIIEPDYYTFGDAFPDGRLVMPGNSFPNFRFIDVYKEVQKLGRPLTDEEFTKFIIPSVETV